MTKQALTRPELDNDSRGKARRTRRQRLLVVGLGNLLLQDDGAGVHAVRGLGRNLPGHALAVDVGCAVLDSLHLLEWADRVLAVDAMRAGGAPGTVYWCDLEDVADEGVGASLHEVGLIAALRFLPEEKRPRVSVLGVEPAHIDYGMELTPPVQAALPLLRRAILDTLAGWARSRSA